MLDRDAVPALHPDAPAPPSRSAVVDWITDATLRGRTVLAAIPPLYAAYATVLVPEERKDRADAALVAVLREHGPQRWWLGYLDTGVADLPEPAQPRVSVYTGWPYVLREGGPEQALAPREHTPWHSALPELLFPHDRSWLVSTMWDDDWRCVGGPAALVEALLASPELVCRAVAPDDDATPREP